MRSRMVKNTQEPPTGADLINIVVELTGLPQERVQTELNQLIESKGMDIKKITLDEFRLVMASYLDSVLLVQ